MTTSLSRQLLQRIAPVNESPEADYTARPPAPRSAFENYIRGILSSDVQKRSELLQTATRLYPQYGPALLQLGRTFHLEKDFKSSNQWLQKVGENSPYRQQALSMTGLNYFYLADYVRAIDVFQQLPPAYDVLLNLGAALLQRGDAAGAIAAWNRAIEIDDLSSEAFFNIGYVSFIKGDLQNAARNLVDSLRLRGRDSEALFLLGRSYEKLGRLDESQKLIAQAARLSQRVERWSTQPIPKLERLALGTVFRNRDEVWTDRRIARLVQAEGVGTFLERVQNQIDLHFYGEAIRELQYLLRVSPDSVDAQSLLEEVGQRQILP
jgi:tetratricopeptide (TPR) repeat protein